jgi:hypothetical protein
MKSLAIAMVLFSFVAQAEYFLAVGCGSTAADAASEAVNAKLPTVGTWYIQEFKTLAFGDDYQMIMQANVQERAGMPCARVTVKGHAGATDCSIREVKVEKLKSVGRGLCR